MSLALQLVLHLIGDYVLQSQSMAARKVTSWRWAALHGVFYTIPFAAAAFFLDVAGWRWLTAVGIIAATHIIIDRTRIAKQLSYAKNVMLPHDDEDYYLWSEARENSGYPKSVPAWMATWLMIILDNVLHIAINAVTIGVLL